MYSAADIKNNRPIKVRAPTKGTKTREVYDLLIAFKFVPLTHTELNKYFNGRLDLGSIIAQLRDFYDMEIIRPKRGLVLFVGFIDYNGMLH